MKKKLSDFTRLQFGVYDKPKDKGDAAYLLARHFDEWGNQNREVDTFTQISRKNEMHLLTDGDIILAGKGQRNFAWTYHQEFGPAMASSMFFVIKPDTTLVIPEFLTTVLNMPQTQSHFQTLGAGSSIPSIRKSELEAFTIQIPSLELQEKAIAIKQLHYKEMDLSRQIIAEKQKVYQAVIKNLIYQKHEQ